jgi:hypothetical protein
MSEPRKYFLTTYTIKVLSEDDHVENLSPREVAEAIDTGDCVGITETSSREISPVVAAEMLFEFGSDPSFFRLDKEGNEED